LVSVVKFIAERGLAFKGDENDGSLRNFFQKIFKHFSSKYLKKDEMLLETGFATVSQIAHRCQMPCCIIKFC